MSIYKDANDLPALDIFEQLFHLALNCKWEGDNIVKNSPDPISQENVSLLLAWPGILMMHMAQLTGDPAYEHELKTIKDMLTNNAGNDQIKEYLDTIIQPKEIPESLLLKIKEAAQNNDVGTLEALRKKSHQYLPKIIITLLLLFHPKNLSFVLDHNLIGLVHSLSHYFVFCSIIIRGLERNDGDIFITNKEIQKEYVDCGLKDRLDIFYISRIWIEILNSIISVDIKNNFKPSQENKDSALLVVPIINTPSVRLIFQRILPENIYAYIKAVDLDSDSYGLERDIGGFGYNISRYFNYKNDLWRLISFNNPESNGYLFYNEKSGFDVLAECVESLFMSARFSAMAAKSLITSWGDFLKDPYKIIDEKIEKFDEWIYSFIFDSYQSRDEFFKFREYTRIVGDIDTEFDYEVAKEVRATYKEAKYYHIPIELRQQLLEAGDELDIFVKLIIRKIKKQDEKIGDLDSVLNFFDMHKEKYRYLSMLELDDIKEIDFTTGANASRDNRRKILPIINQKLGGRDFRGSTLTKLLGLEPGEGKYLKYSI